MDSRDRKAGASRPGLIHLRIVEVMKRFPEGVSGGQIRQELENEGLKAEDQTHLDRRKRDLKKWFVIQKKASSVVVNGKKRSVILYQYGGERKVVTDEGQIGIKLRGVYRPERRALAFPTTASPLEVRSRISCDPMNPCNGVVLSSS